MGKRSPIYLEAFAKRLRAAMEAKGLSQADLARLLARNQDEARKLSSAISRWCSAEHAPDPEILPKLAEVLGVSVDWLLTGKEAAIAAEERDARVVQALEAEVKQLRAELARVHGVLGQLLPGPGASKPSKRRP